MTSPSAGTEAALGPSKGALTSIWTLVFAAICLDSFLAPALNTIVPTFSCGLLLVLLLRREPRRSAMASAEFRFPNQSRLMIFLLLHIAAVVTARMYQTSLLGSALQTGLRSVAIASAKYLILLPTLVLLPLPQWRAFTRIYRSELAAAGLALLTLFPYHAFHAMWPWYSQVLGHVAYGLAHPFVYGLKFLPSAPPVLVGPALDVVVIPDCGGLGAIKLFQIVFTLVLIFDWNSLDKFRALVGYWLGMGLMLAANAVRIALLVIIGNQGSTKWIVKHHITASWIFLAVALATLLLAGYRLLFLSGGMVQRQLDLGFSN